MVAFSRVATAVVGLSAVASAVPTPPRQGFTLNQVPSKLSGRGVNLPGIYRKGLAKYGATIPTHILDAEAHGSAVTTPEANDVAYLTPVDIGGKTLNLDFDTGSADLWVFSTELSSSQQQGHTVYEPSGNATKLSGYSWQISYGDSSSASGDVYRDTVTVGGVTAQGQAVEAAKQVSSSFAQDQDNDGLLGLAFSSINTVQPKAQTTFFDTVKSQLDSPLFAVALKHNEPGTYDFGFVDKSKYTGSLTYADVDNSQGFWGFSATAGGSQFSAIADTGTTLLLIDSSIAQDYYQKVPQASNSQSYGGWTFPCSSKLPSFTVTINDYDAVVPGDIINYAPVSEGSSTCFGGIQENQGLQFSILGDIFLKSQYVVFDSQGPRLGFAPQA